MITIESVPGYQDFLMAYMEIGVDLWTDFEGKVGDRGLLKLFGLSIVCVLMCMLIFCPTVLFCTVIIEKKFVKRC